MNIALEASSIKFFAQYLCIGAIVMSIDFGLFWLLMRLGVTLAPALSIAYAVGVSVHFTLNRFLNFRNFDRAIHHQFRTYLAIVFVSWLITLAVTEVGFRLFGLPPMLAKVCAVLINIPLGFFGHRYLTFGRGIFGTAKALFERTKKQDRDQIARHG